MKPSKSIKGFSLIEVLIFVTVFSLFFVMAAAVVTTTLRITKQNQNKIRATHYAEELREWLSSEKEINWGGSLCSGCIISNTTPFTERTTQVVPKTDFCFNDPLLPQWPGPGASSCYMNLDNQYRRIATFSATSVVGGYVNQVGVSISVEWKEGSQTLIVPMQAVFSIWE